MNSEERQKGSGHQTGQTARKKCLFPQRWQRVVTVAAPAGSTQGWGCRWPCCEALHIPPEDKSPQTITGAPQHNFWIPALNPTTFLAPLNNKWWRCLDSLKIKTPRATPRPPASLRTHPWRVPAPHQNYQRRLEPLRNCCYSNLPTLPVWGTPPAPRCSTACTPSTLLEGSEHGALQMGQHGRTAPIPSCWGALFGFKKD